MRLIDAEQFDVIAYETKGKEEWTDFDEGVSFVIDKIDNAPTVDAVEVVRCKDCKYREPTKYEAMYCRLWDVDDYKEAYVSEDDFCSRGERR